MADTRWMGMKFGVLLPLFLNKRMKKLKTQFLSWRSRSALTSPIGKYPSPQIWPAPSCLSSFHDPASLLSARPQDHSSLLLWWLHKSAAPHNLQPAPILCQSRASAHSPATHALPQLLFVAFMDYTPDTTCTNPAATNCPGTSIPHT